MTQTKKELVLAAMDNKPTERVPSGFWFHFLKDEIHSDAFQQPELNDELLAGEIKYIDTVQPDFVKIMTDGFFPYENDTAKNLQTAADFRKIKPLAKDDPWFTQQIAYAKKLTGRYGEDTPMFYNVFCAGTTIKFMRPELATGEAFLAEAIEEDPSAVRQGLEVIANDLAELAERIIREGGATGIYLSLQNLIGKGITRKIYDEVMAPGEKEILAAANRVSPYNILHICGWSGHRNNLSWYADYDVKTINWAAVVEGVSLEEGRKIFDQRAAIGGFGNEPEDILYKGAQAEVEQETKRILQQAGRQGILLGADCTVPRDTDWQRFEWVRQAAR